MAETIWPTENWPEGVAHDIDFKEYDMPLYQILDDSARDYPDHVYTVFNDGTRTFSEVKDTADSARLFCK